MGLILDYEPKSRRRPPSASRAWGAFALGVGTATMPIWCAYAFFSPKSFHSFIAESVCIAVMGTALLAGVGGFLFYVRVLACLRVPGVEVIALPAAFAAGVAYTSIVYLGSWFMASIATHGDTVLGFFGVALVTGPLVAASLVVNRGGKT